MNMDNENIIKILGIESLPDERKIEIIEMATDLVQKRLVLRVLDILNPDEREEFGQILEQGSSGLIDEFMEKHAPNFGDWIIEEISKVKGELAGFARKIDLDSSP